MVENRSTSELISDCVHCGFCLPACPTYRSWGVEMDSPRGRIDLMKGLNEGAIDLTDGVVAHFDQCLGCMGCVTACPSGVRYDLLIESTRAKIEAAHPRSPDDAALREAIFAVFPYPERLRALAWPLYFATKSGLQSLLRRSGLLKILPARLAQLLKMAPPLSVDQLTDSLPSYTAARGPKRGTVALVAGCVQRVFFPGVNAATIRVLAAEGYDVIVPSGQGCCGALSLHVGRDDEARRFAAALVDGFGDVDALDAVIVNAAGCGSTLKQYGELLTGQSAEGSGATAPGFNRFERFAHKVKDVTEFLAGVAPRAERNPMPLRVAYHDACHLGHAQRIREQPRALLRSIPGLELVEIPEGDQCCGSAGVYNILEPQSAAEIGARKVQNVLSTAPDVVASANPGCTLQMASILADSGMKVLSAHPIEILDAALA